MVITFFTHSHSLVNVLDQILSKRLNLTYQGFTFCDLAVAFNVFLCVCVFNNRVSMCRVVSLPSHLLLQKMLLAFDTAGFIDTRLNYKSGPASDLNTGCWLPHQTGHALKVNRRQSIVVETVVTLMLFFILVYDWNFFCRPITAEHDDQPFTLIVIVNVTRCQLCRAGPAVLKSELKLTAGIQRIPTAVCPDWSTIKQRHGSDHWRVLIQTGTHKLLEHGWHVGREFSLDAWPSSVREVCKFKGTSTFKWWSKIYITIYCY